MKQRTRKLWTVLVAAVFVIAVAFGLGLALVLGRENAHSTITAEAVEGDFYISSEQGEKVLYSYEKLTGSTVGETFIYSSSDNTKGFISGTVGGSNLWTYQDDVVLLVYSDEACTNRVYDLRPREAETGSTFTRYFRVQVVVDGRTLTSNSISLTITAAQPDTSIFDPGMTVSGSTIFPALTSIDEETANRLTVTMYYAVDGNNAQQIVNTAITLSFTGVDADGNPKYGGYWIEYQDDADVDDRTDVFEFDDDYIYICYKEAGWETPIKVQYYIDVTEAYVDAPIPDDAASAFTSATYNGKDHDFEFDSYSATSSTATVHEYQPFVSGWTDSLEEKIVDSDESTITYSASEAGTYSVTFHANTGYQYRSIPSAAVSVIIRETQGSSTQEVTYEGTELEELKNSGEELSGTLLSVTYEWNIEKATITGATIAAANRLPASWKYGSQPDPDEPTAGEIALTTSPSIENLTAASETIFAAGTSHTNFIYKSTDGTSYSSTALPSDAGEYTWAVQLTGMNNFKDYTGSATAFEIYKQVVELPALDETSFEYDGSSHAPQLKEPTEDTLYGTLLVAEQTAAGSYEATLTLTDPDNYEWADPEEGSGITVSGATATYSWSIGKAVNTIKDLSIADWTWGGTANAPSASATFGGDITYTYHKTQDGEQISADALKDLGAGTYWVKAVSAATDDYDADTEWLEFEVKKAALARPSLAQSALTYNGKAQAPVLGDDFQSDLANGYYTFVAGEQTLVNASGKTYEATVTLDENHCWADNGTDVITLTWTIAPAEITTEGELSRTGWTYGAAESTLVNTLKVTVDFATTDDVLSETLTYYQKNGDNFEAIDGEPENAGTYRVEVTFSYSENANGVSNFVPKTITSQEFTIKKDTLEFDTITEGELDWMWGQVDGLAISSFAPKATYGVSEGESVTATLTYYYADGFSVDASGVASGTQVGDDFANLPAGSYKVYAYVAEGTNYKAGYQVYDFEVKQADPDGTTEKVEYSYDITINNQGDWTYDDETDHAISVTVKVGGHTLESGEYTVYYFTRGWNESDDWGNGVELELQDDGYYRMPETYDAGEYYIGVAVKETANHADDTLAYDEGNAFTVHRKQISIPEEISRQLEYTASTQQAPSELISNVANGTLNADWEWASVVSFVGYADYGEDTYDSSAPSAYGTYYLRLELNEPNNYAWVKVDDELADYSDEITGDSKEYYDVVFQITGKDYRIVVTANGWTYGGTITVPTFDAATGEDYATSLKAALEEGVTVTYSFYRLESQSDTSDGTLVKSVSVSDGDYGLDAMPKEIAENPGYYRVVVSISESEQRSYASASAEADFTVAQHALTNGDIDWTVPADLNYRGTAFTFDAEGNGGDDIYATYKNWTYNESTGKYVEATSPSYLEISLGGATEIKNAGQYTLNAALPKGESNITLADSVSAKTNTVEIKKLALTVSASLKDSTILYGDAAPTDFDDYNITLGGYLNETEKAALEALLKFAAQNYTADAENGYSIVGSYDINVTFASGDVLNNYTFDGNAITEHTVVDTVEFTVEARPITVTIADKTSVYGDNIVDLTYTIDGQPFDDASNIFTLSTTAKSSSDVSTYDITGTADGSRAGNYIVTFKGETSGSAGKFTITARKLTVTASVNETIEYGDAAPTAASAYTVTITNALEKDEELLKSLLAFAPQYSVGDNAGTTYNVNVSFTENAILKNYGITAGDTVTTAQLTVVERKVTVTINNIETEYGTPKAFEVSYKRGNGTGGDELVFLEKDLESGTGVEQFENIFTLALEGGYTPNASLNAGTYTIAGTDESTNYAVTFVGSVDGSKGTYKVTPRKIEVDFALNAHGDRSDLIFDGSAWTYTATGKGSYSGVTFDVTYSGAVSNGSAVNAGDYTVSVVQDGASGLYLSTDKNYQAAAGTQSTSFTITPREVEVTWTAQTDYTYNKQDQSGKISATYYAWVSGSESTTATNLTIDDIDFTDWKEGGYTFTAGLTTDLEQQNYTLIGAGDDGKVTKVYTMQKAAITVAIVGQDSEYGEPLVDFSNLAVNTFYTITDGTLYDNANDVFSFATNATSTSGVGFYTINATHEGDRAHNYTVTFTGGTNAYEVTKRNVTVTLSTHSETYQNEMFSAFTATLDEDYTVDRLVSGDNLNITLTPKTDAINVGSYAYFSVAADNTNYNVTFANASAAVFEITRAKITVTIDDKESVYGDDLVELKCSTEDDLFRNDLSNILKLAIYRQNDLSTPVSVPENGHLDAGDYTISIVGSNGTSPYESANFEVSFETATYTVKRKTAEVHISVVAHEYSDGTSLSTPTYDGSAWIYEAIATGVDGETVKFEVTYAARNGSQLTDGYAVNAGDYTYTVNANAEAMGGNYIAETTVNQDFTIAKREVKVTWTENNFTYNGTNQFSSISATYQPWKDGSQLTGEADAVKLSITTQEFKNANTYTFTATLSDPNYVMDADTGYSVEDGITAKKDYTMQKAAITVTVNAQSSYYGEDIADLTASDVYSISGDTYDDVEDIFTLTAMNNNGSALVKGDAAGNYYIKGEAVNSNYAVSWSSYTSGTQKVADYTIARRPVKISIGDFNMIYGTDLAGLSNDIKATLSSLAFELGDNLTGTAFVSGDTDAESTARRLIAFAFENGYGATSSVNTTWEVTASLANQDEGDLKNYTFVTDTAEMTVIPRPITVTLPSINDYTYGTQLLNEAFDSIAFDETVAIGSAWADDYGAAIVNNDDVASIYRLFVKGTSGEITLSASSPIGDYTFNGEAEGNGNYAVTFVNNGTGFKVTPAKFEVVDPESSVEVTYTGENYYFRSDAATSDSNAASEYLFNHALNVVTESFVLNKGDITYNWTFTVSSGSVTYLTAADEYTVSYTVTADNFTEVSGTFTVKITAAGNFWQLESGTATSGYEFATTWYYGTAIDGGVSAENEYETDQEAPKFTAYMGTMIVEYYKTRSGEAGSYSYSNKITEGADYFGKTTPAGTYYVKVYVNATSDYGAIEAHGVITVEKRTVDVNWAHSNISLDVTNTNVTIGFDSSLMELDTNLIPDGLTVAGNPNEDGEIEVTVSADAGTQLSLYFELSDPANYCWPETSTTVSGDGKIKHIFFSVNATVNNVVFVDANGNTLAQDTGITIVYGDALTWKFATNADQDIGGNNILIRVDSIIDAAGGLSLNTTNVQFVKATGDTDPRSYIYNLSTLNGADAGTYWMRVQVFPDESLAYAYGIGYLKVTIGQKEVTQDDIDSITFGTGADGKVHFTYNGEQQLPTAENVPDYLNVKFSVADGGAVNAGDHAVTATISIVGGNYMFASGATTEKTITVVIDKAPVTVSWVEDTFTYNGADQLENVNAYFVDVDGHIVRLKVSVSSGSTTEFLTAGSYTMQAAFVSYDDGTTLDNYTFAAENGGETHGFVMNKLHVVIGLIDQDAVYTGKNAEIDGDAYYVDMFTHDRAAEIDRYKALLGELTITGYESAKNVGTYTLKLDGTENNEGYYEFDNYLVTANTATFTITPASLDFEWKSFANGVYGGANGVTLDGTEFSNFVNSESYAAVKDFVTITYSGMSWSGQKYENSTDVPDEAGNYIVTVTLAATGAEGAACNYSMQAQSRVYVIEKATVAVPTIDSKEYNGENQTATITENDFKVITNDGGTDAGSYPVVLELVDSANHQWITSDGLKVDSKTFTAQFVITRADGYEFTVSIDGWTYGGAAKSPVLTYLTTNSLPEGGRIVYLYTGTTNGNVDYESEFAPTQAGTYTVTVTITGMKNYTDATATSTAFIVERAEAVIDVSGMLTEFDYDGNAHAITGAVLNHNETTLIYSITSVTAAGRYDVIISAAQTDNYKAVERTVTIIVNEKGWTLEVSITGWVYGEKGNAPTYTAHPEGLQATVEYAKFGSNEFSTTVPTDAGDYIVRVSYEKGTNYAAAVGTATFTIAKAEAIIDTDGMQTEYTYTGVLQTITGAKLTQGDATLQYFNNTFINVPVDGKLNVMIYAPETDNYKSATATVTITINKADMTIEVSIGGWTYGDAAEEPGVTYLTGTKPADGYLEYLYTGTMNGNRPYSSSAVPTEAGEYTLTVTLNGMANYKEASDEVTFTIGRAQAVINTDNVETDYTYNGKLQTVTGATLNHNETTLVYTNNTFTDVPESGELEVTITANETNNYEKATATVTVKVNKADYTFFVDAEDWTYGEDAVLPTLINTSGMPTPGDCTVTYEYAGYTNGGAEYTATSIAPTLAGEYTVTVTLSGMRNYNDVTIGPAEFTIERAPLTPEIEFLLKVEDANGWTYGETPAEADIWTFSGFDPGEAYWTAYYTRSASGLVSAQIPTEAGQYTLTVVVKETDNYLAGTSAPVSFKIFKAQPEFTIEIIPQLENGAGWTYGETPEDIWKFVDDFVPTGDVTVNYSGTTNGNEPYNSKAVPTDANDDMGVYTLTVTIAESDNYLGGTATATFTIARATAVINTDNVVKEYTYNGMEQTVTGATLNHDEAELVYSNNTFTDVPVSGKLDVTISAAQTDNYESAETTVTITIKKAALNLKVTIEGWTYGERANTPSVTGNVGGGSIFYRYTGTTNGGVEYDSDEAPALAGSYTVKVSVGETANYLGGTAECKFIVERADTIINTSGVKTQYTYNGERQLVTSGATLNHNETAPVYTNNILTDADVYYVVISAEETDNFKAAQVTVRVVVEKAALGVAVSIENWTYGDAPNDPVIIYTSGLRPDDAEISYHYNGTTNGGVRYSSDEAPTLAGTYTVTATLSGMKNFADAFPTSRQFMVERADAVIDTSGVRTDFTYDGEEHSVTGGAVLNHNETTLVYSSNTFTDAGEYDVTISAEQTDNYEAAEVTVTVVVHKAALGLNVTIDGWTYGEEPNAPSVTGNVGGGEVTYRYTGTTNAGAAYESELAPTEAGEYTVTATAAETDNYQIGTASADFTVGRAAAETQLTLEDWYFGDEPNAYVLTPDFLMDEVIRVLYADEDGSFSEKPPVYAGEYTITVYYGETANYTAGEATASFTVIERPLQMSVTLEDWTYGDEPNEPVVTGAYGIALTYRYTGTANDGTSWNSDTAPVKAGEYTLTVTTADLENYDNATCSTDFTIMRRLISAPAWDEEGLREFTEEHNGKTNTIIVVGYDGSLMTAEADGVRFELTTGGGAAVAADIHGVHTIIFTLKDAANYGWTDRNEGEGLTDPVTLTWTLTEHVISILWLIILLAVLVLIALIILIVLLKKNKKYGKGNTPDGGAAGTQGASPDGNTAEGEAVQAAGESGAADQGTDGSQGGSGETRLSSFAPIGLLLVIVPLGEVIAAIVLGVVLVGLIIADIAVGVRVHKLAKAAEAASDLGTRSEEIASAEKAMASEDVPDESAEEVADVQLEEGLETAAADDAAYGEGEYPDAAYSEGEPADGFGTQGEDAGTNPDGADRPEDMGGLPE